MYIIVSYDVNKKRVGKVMKICRKYLKHVQKSLFEGMLTEAEENKLKKELAACIDVNTDSICIYNVEYSQCIVKEEIGVIAQFSNII